MHLIFGWLKLDVRSQFLPCFPVLFFFFFLICGYVYLVCFQHDILEQRREKEGESLVPPFDTTHPFAETPEPKSYIYV